MDRWLFSVFNRAAQRFFAANSSSRKFSKSAGTRRGRCIAKVGKRDGTIYSIFVFA